MITLMGILSALSLVLICVYYLRLWQIKNFRKQVKPGDYFKYYLSGTPVIDMVYRKDDGRIISHAGGIFLLDQIYPV